MNCQVGVMSQCVKIETGQFSQELSELGVIWGKTGQFAEELNE